MQKCRKCRKDKDLSEFDTKFDGTPLYLCKGCMVIHRSEKPKKSYIREAAVMRAKGRQLRKLSEVQVAEIREKKKAGATNVLLASEYGVSHSTIHKVATTGYR